MELNQQVKEALESGYWYLNDNGWLRTREAGGVFCPLTYAYFLKTKEVLTLDAFIKAGNKLGLTEDETFLIMRAADDVAWHDEGHKKEITELRQQMINVTTFNTSLWFKFKQWLRS